MKKICIIGGPSTGKTTVALMLTAQIKMMGYEAYFVSEFATDYIIKIGEPKSVFEQIIIFLGQKEKEEHFCLGEKVDFIICDAAPFGAYIYSKYYPEIQNEDNTEKKKKKYATEMLCELSRKKSLSTYDFIFFLTPEIPFKKNKIRWQSSKKESEKISKDIENYLELEKVKFHRISGALQERIKKIIKIMGLKRKK